MPAILMAKAARALIQERQPHLPLQTESLRSLYSLPPPLKWAGGKRWQLPYLKKYWEREKHRRLVQPFCGGLAVTLGLLPERALLNDINPHLISFYRWLKRGLNISIEMTNNERSLYNHRKRFNEQLRTGKASTKDAASLFYYLNRTGYNGLSRFNRSGEFNVPFGKHTTINYKQNFSAYKAVLANWEFANAPFESNCPQEC
jgi:DNA adenine methylase